MRHQLAFAREVILKSGVFDRADVVRRNVEECAHVESEAEHAVDLVRLAGNLHHHMRHAVVNSLAQKVEKVEAFRRRQLRFHIGFAVHAVIYRAEQGRLIARQLGKKVMHVVGGGRLALRAGDADHRQLLLRMAVELGAEQSHGLMHVGNYNPQGFGVLAHVSLRHIAAQRVQPVEVFGFEVSLAKKQRTFAHFSRVVADVLEAQVGLRPQIVTVGGP